MSTSSPVTFGDTADSVGSRLNTIQGCRPISVKIQPTIIAASESGKLQTATFQTQACFGTEEAALTLLYGLVAFGQIQLRKIDGYRDLSAFLAREGSTRAA